MTKYMYVFLAIIGIARPFRVLASEARQHAGGFDVSLLQGEGV